MSAPPNTTRQRSNYAAKVEDEPEQSQKTENPASLSTNSSKKVPRNKPHVKPPFADVSMNRFLVYLVLGLLAVMGFYGWRFTVYVHEVGGYWNALTGHRASAVDAAATAANAAASVAAKNAKSNSNNPITQGRSHQGSGAGSGQADVQTQIYNLATALGIKPAELSNAIRPLIDPSVPNPAVAAQHEKEILEAKIKDAEAGGNQDGPGFLGLVGEALLD